MKQNKKYKLKTKSLIFIILLLIVTIVGATYAYFTSETRILNQFKNATYNVQLEEEFNDDWGTKKVWFANNEETNTPVVLRINYNESWTKEDKDGFLTLSNIYEGENVVTKNWTSDFTDNFTLGSDGWYYYNKVLKPQEKVQVLESIEKNAPAEYDSYNYQLTFNFEAIQATESAVKELWDKTITIDGDNIQWIL